MKKREQWKEQVVSALEMPADLAYSETIVTMTGPSEVLIENYRCILKYTCCEIVIATLRGRVSICGSCLEIPWYAPDQMLVKGRISGIYPQRQQRYD